jgi:DNA invertase Pin-like site-specific DNA recombinase
MANELVIRKSHLPGRRDTFLAAQYVRMSTDKQRYSIENQAAVIAAYAQAHNLRIVKTYRDDGESGLRLKNRIGLIQLLDDVKSGHADFDHILVYDVSRWGRFQDTDESAHYEYICKHAGKKVAYCAEQFDNDGSMLSSIVKNLKRVMAAEYSRELSAKVHAGATRFARLGFKLGGLVSYGLRRQLVDERLQPKAVLERGQRKYLLTDHVRLILGDVDEVAIVRWIFEQFLERRSETAIARELNQRAVPTTTGRRWDRALIGRIIRNENYIGNLLYNRRSRKLGESNVYNSPDLWIRSEGCIATIVKPETFLAAKRVIERRRVDLSEEEMLVRLRKTLMKRGKLNPTIINDTVGLPCVKTFMDHFGSLRNVYRLIGYKSHRDCEYIESRQGWADMSNKLAMQLGQGLKDAGLIAVIHNGCLRVSEGLSVSFRVARWTPGKLQHHAPLWSINRRVWLPDGWVVALRLGEHNREVMDYLLFPAAVMNRSAFRFSEKAREHHEVESFKPFEALARSLVRRIRGSRVSLAKPARPKPARPKTRTRKKAVAARR